jgi:excisionase family DNA binding protein
MQILRGRCHDALPGDLRLLRDQLWDALPYRPPSPAIGAIAEGPAFLSIAQVARFLSLAPATVRCLASAEKSLGAIKIGRFVRIPRASLLSFLEQRCGLARPRRGSSVTLRQAAETLGVTTAVIRHAVRLGRIRTLHGGRHQRPRISGRELERVMRAGTQPLPEVRPRVRRAKHAPALS